MPSHAYVNFDLICSACDEKLGINMTAFSWGYCPGHSPRTEHVYRQGNEIYWKKCDEFGTPSWTYFKNGIECNIGDPNFENLIVRDSSIYWFDGHNCKTCSEFFAGAIVKIVNSKIISVRPYKIGEFDNGVDIYLINPDGTIAPKIEWQDHPMTKIMDC